MIAHGGIALWNVESGSSCFTVCLNSLKMWQAMGINKGLTDLEKEALEVFYMVRSAVERKLGRVEFMEFMMYVRNITQKLENKKYGCAIGKHTTACDCKEGEI